jgi:Holliday junction resolvase RusA-like endonuclease
MRIHIPLPPTELSPNRRVHWAKKNQAVQCYKTDCRWTVRKARCDNLLPTTWPLFAHASMQLTVIKRRVKGCYLPRDPDNAIASVKAAIDAMTCEGLWVDDSPKFLTILPIKFETPKRGSKETGIRVTIEESEK